MCKITKVSVEQRQAMLQNTTILWLSAHQATPEICPRHHKIFSLLSKRCKLVCFGAKILNFVHFGVNKSGISVFLVSAEWCWRQQKDKYHVCIGLTERKKLRRG